MALRPTFCPYEIDPRLLPKGRLHSSYLFPNYGAELCVHNLGVQLAAHQGGPLVVLDVALVDGLWQFDVLAEALLLEVADGKLVGKRQEVVDAVANVIVLQKSFFVVVLCGTSTIERRNQDKRVFRFQTENIIQNPN